MSMLCDESLMSVHVGCLGILAAKRVSNDGGGGRPLRLREHDVDDGATVHKRTLP